MGNISIPDSSLKQLKALIALDNSLFDRLLEVLPNFPTSISDSKIHDEITTHFATSDQPKIAPIVRELIAISAFGNQAKLASDKLSDEVMLSASEIHSSEFDLSENELQLLRERLQASFDKAPALRVTAKTLDVLSDNPRIFYSSRVLTDLRPIFTDDGQQVEGGAILHTLVLHYGDDEKEHKDLFICLDAKDISALRSTLDQAEENANAIRSFLEKANVPYIDAGE